MRPGVFERGSTEFDRALNFVDAIFGFSVTLLVTRDTVYVNGAAVVPLDAVRTSDGSVVEALVVALRDVGGRGMLSGGTERREVTVLADRDLPYSVMRRIMASASAADYTAVSLAVIEKSRAGAASG